jgi:HD-GYP domain-containing protein (c-di-GMP phosphodiesterase class II)
MASSLSRKVDVGMLVSDIARQSHECPKFMADQAQAHSFALREEFGVSFSFFDAASGNLVRDGSMLEGQGEYSSAQQIVDWAADGRAVVELQTNGKYRLVLPLPASGRPQLVAVGIMVSVAGADSDDAREANRLKRWGQAVCDRIRLTSDLIYQKKASKQTGSGSSEAGHALALIEVLSRDLNFQQEPAAQQQAIITAALAVVPVQSLIWVPHDPQGVPLIRGDKTLSPLEFRQLVDLLSAHAEIQRGQPYICNATLATIWGPRFPRLSTILAWQAFEHEPMGWLVAVNKKAPGAGDTPLPGALARTLDLDAEEPDESFFRKADASLLSPFVAMLEMHQRAANRYKDLKTLLVGLTRSLTSALDAKDAYTYGHSERVARIAMELGRELGLSVDELSDLYLVGLLHDVGNLGIRDAILSTTDPLTAEQYEHIKQHVTLGYSILSDLHPIRHLLPGVLFHHENYDGSGYPDGLVGDAIPLIARILAVAEACDAMSNKRPYRDALPHRQVEQRLVEGSGKQWDPRVVDAFLRCRHKIRTIRQRGIGPSLHGAIDRALRGERSGPAHLDVPADDAARKEPQHPGETRG